VASDDARPRADQRVTVRVTVVSALMGVGIVVLGLIGQRIFVAAHRPLSWAAAAAVVAVLLDPLVCVLGRRIRSRRVGPRTCSRADPASRGPYDSRKIVRMAPIR